MLGYSDKEAKVYLASLTLGESRVSDLARKTKIPRTSVQDIVEKLRRNGLVSSYVRKRYTYWVAENPRHLLDVIEARQSAVQTALPALEALHRGKKNGRPQVKVYSGLEEIRFIFEDIIATKQSISALIAQDEFITLFAGTTIWDEFTEARVAHFLPIRVLVPNTKAGHLLIEGAERRLCELKFLPATLGIQTAIFVYGTKVALIMMNKKQPTALIIDDSGTRDTNAALFEELWNRDAMLDGEDFFQRVADASPHPLLIANDKAEIEYVNAAWVQRFGYTSQEVRGKNARILQSGKTPRRVYDAMWKALGEGKTFQSDEVIDRTKSGSEFTLLTTIFPVRTKNRVRYIQIVSESSERRHVMTLKSELLSTARQSLVQNVRK